MRCKSILTAILISSTFCSVGLSQFVAAPKIDEQQRVTIEVTAPDAKYVKLIAKTDPNAIGAAEYDFVKGDEDKWTVTTKPCRPGLHYYAINVDGFECSDPWAQAYFGWARWSSMVEVPDPKVDFYLPKDVPHGDVRFHWYHSKVTGKVRKCLVYTPPGYDTDTSRRYPVLYLQHGSGESELGWMMQGKCNFIMDNLLAEGKATPMLIVMDNGYATKPGDEDNRGASWGRRNSAFTELVIEDLIPNIDKNFRTLTDRKNRAIAGLSMGAGQAMRTGFGNLDKFASVGAFSGGSRNFDPETSYNGVFKDPKQANEKIDLFWFGMGDLEGGYEGSKQLDKTLTEHGIDHVRFECHGSHEWQVWRYSLRDFAQKVFQK